MEQFLAEKDPKLTPSCVSCIVDKLQQNYSPLDISNMTKDKSVTVLKDAMMSCLKTCQ